MTVYADVLIIINAVIDYFILLTAKRLAKVECKTYKCILASLLGGFLSLYIFAPDYGIVVNMSVWLLSCAVITLTVSGKREFKKIFKLFISFVFSNAVYGGIVMIVWSIFKPKAMLIYNGVVYYHVSPFILLLVTVFCYMAVSLSERLMKLKAPMAKRCSIELSINGETVRYLAIIDTGHTLCDPFSEKSVILVDELNANYITQKINSTNYRLIPYNDISKKGILNGFTADKATIILDDRKYVIDKPIIAFVKKGMLPKEFGALISPQILSQETECVKL